MRSYRDEAVSFLNQTVLSPYIYIAGPNCQALASPFPSSMPDRTNHSSHSELWSFLASQVSSLLFPLLLSIAQDKQVVLARDIPDKETSFGTRRQLCRTKI
jgi:hypothetical protein